MELKPGYKQTGVGVIPEDWEVVLLRQLILSVEYGSSAKSNVQGDTPVLRMGNLQDGKINWSDLVYTNDESEIEKYALDPGDVLFNRTNTIDLVGKTSIYRGERPAIFAGYLIRIKVDQSRLDSEYLNFVLNAEFSKRHSAKVLSVAVGQANINGQKVKTYPIPLPPTLAEQQAIVEALSDADALIESLDQLIAKKRAIKQGAMQQLLTGKTRLPRFVTNPDYLQTEVAVIPADWRIEMLEGLCVPRGLIRGPFGGTLKKKFFTSDGFKVYEQRNAIYRDPDLGSYFIDEAKYRELSRFQVQEGDFIVSCSGTIGKIFQIPKFAREGVINQALLLIRTDSRLVDDKYFFYVFDWDEFQKKILDNTHGGAMQNLVGMDVFRSVSIFLPPLAEQQAIAAILCDMDAEIAALEQRRDKTKLLKQGMMQELLTGKTRLI